ncbi:FAD-binding dehydrogenase [Rhodoferax koreense]|uniref:FAD-binding dehydrogenase n=1 Tax=Rhodoferax koreensis TaxID=1842727 RepID=A0A1P8K318_9BURK|nr:FAD-dependent oxidoreductase [Rhodoferax koreense]APW40404.1 FAD-binding dehydrogenase [Rhodoferax koreense]
MQLLSSLAALPEAADFDVVVIGAGGAGMSAALFAAIDGKKVLLVERSEYVGGTTAVSAGTTWVPGTRHAAKVNPNDSLQEAARYLDNAVGSHSPQALRQAFLQNGKTAVDIVEDHSDLHYRPYPKHPDYISDLGGSTLNGRALEPLPFDGRELGELFKLIRPPIPEFTVLGGMMVDRTDINHLLALGKSMASFKHAVKIIARHGMDRLSHPRGTRLVMGNALVGRLLLSLSKRSNVSLLLNTSLGQLVRGAEGAKGVESVLLIQEGQRRTVNVRGGVILASGGFNRHAQLRSEMIPGVPAEWSPTAPVNFGEAHGLAKQLGAHYGKDGASHAFWAPVSLRKRADGSSAAFPHFVMDRAKPGMITVNQKGERFVNESTSYHLFGLAMQQAHKTVPSIPAYMIADAQALAQYGMGMVRPGGKGLAPFLADGYLVQADTLDELAQKLGIDAEGLKASVAKNNAYADSGVDPDFQRGVTAYQQNIGDATRGGKNPNLGRLAQGPYYAIRLYPGDIGAATGLATDADARVLGQDEQPIPGLYAVGNDMQSVMGGVYTAPGITIGPGLVFGYLAAKHAGARAATNLRSP